MRTKQENGTHSHSRIQHITKVERLGIQDEVDHADSIEEHDDVAQDLSMATDDVASDDIIES